MHGNYILLLNVTRRIYSEKKKKQNKANGAVQVGRYIFFRQLPINALEEEILSAYGATFELDNQKNDWKGVCVYQEKNGD